MRSIFRPRTFIVVPLCIAVTMLLVRVAVRPPEIPQTDAFPLIEQHVIYNVDDAGTADLDGNGQLDRWTTNHSAAQWIAMNGASGRAGYMLGLAQDPTLPGLEEGNIPVPRSRPVRLYMDDTRFVIDAEGDGDLVAEGTITIPWRAEARHEGAAEAWVMPCDALPKCHRAGFRVRDGGRVWIEPVPAPSDGFTVTFEFAASTDLSQVQVGTLALPPPGHRFTYASKDRHGLALADPDGDGVPDIFVSRGGARGELDTIEPDATDEWFEWEGTAFVEKIGETGIAKRGCPGRQTAWMDIDEDGLLDLYQVCGRSRGANEASANRLYRQVTQGRFEEAAESYGLDLPGSGSFRFFRHARPGAPPMVLWAPAGALALYSRGTDGRYSEAWSVPRQGGDTDKIALSDLDRDGEWEALVLSPKGNTLARLRPDTAELLDPADFGLPRASVDGMFVHLDGDRWLDFFSVPQGIFLGGPDGGFTPADALDMSWLDDDPNVRFAWFDADADGDLDLWLLKRNGKNVFRPVRSVYNRVPPKVQDLMVGAFGRGELRSRYWLSVLYENRLARGAVRILKVTGPEGRELPAGVPVEVGIRTDGTTRTEYHLTGETDSSRLSQTRTDVAVAATAGDEIIELRPVVP